MQKKQNKKLNRKWLLSLVLCIAFFGIIFGLNFAVAQDAFGLQTVEDSPLNLAGGDLRLIIGKIIRAVLGFLGIIAVSIVLYGGFVYMTSAGNQEKITRARKILINGVIGLVIILTSFIIVQFVISRLSQAIGGGGGGIDCDSLEGCDVGGGGGLPGGDCGNVFAVRSITPNQEKTGMNNITIRGVFTQSVGTPVDEIFTITKDEQNINSDVSFSFVPVDDDKHKQKVVEAVYTAKDIDGNGYCSDPAQGDCTPADNAKYVIILNENVVSIDDEPVEEGLVECLGYESLEKAEFSVDVVFDDKQKPTISPLSLIDPQGNKYSGSQIKIPAGKKYVLAGVVDDNSGVGYIHLTVSSEDGSDSIERYDGPIKSDEPFDIDQLLFIGSGMPTDVIYTATVTAYDIDNNSQTATIEFSIAPAHCSNGVRDEEEGELGIDTGGPCGGGIGDSCEKHEDCAAGLFCGPDGYCTAYLEIVDVDPLDGSPGNWSTILGRHFGITEGRIQFAADGNANGFYDDDEWVDADLAQCTLPGGSWANSYAITEVPVGFSVGDETSIRIIKGEPEDDSFASLFGSAAKFDGELSAQGDFLQIPNNDILNMVEDQEFSVSVWVKPIGLPENQPAIVMRKGEYGTRESYAVIISRIPGNNVEGRVSCSYNIVQNDNPETHKTYRVDGDSARLNEWNHIVCGRKSDRVFININGEHKAEKSYETGVLGAVSNDEGFFVGGVGLGASYTVGAFEGSIDELTIFSKALSDETISDLYYTGLLSGPDNYISLLQTQSPIVHYSLNEEDDDVAIDAINDLNGTYENGVTLGSQGIFTHTDNLVILDDQIFFTDNTTNDYGNKPGPVVREGRFLFTDVGERPGLCSVSVAEDHTVMIDGVEKTFSKGSLIGPPKAPVLAEGKAFGNDPELWFGSNNKAKIDNLGKNALDLDEILSSVPGNIKEGQVGVYVQDGDKKSNGVPFSIAQTVDEVFEPDIVTIDPPRTTPGSYVTLHGTDFGDVEGSVYAASSQQNVITCGTENAHISCEKLNTNDFPPQCGGNLWTDTQVIAEIPEEIKQSDLFEDKKVENPIDFLMHAGVSTPHSLQSDSDAVFISAELLPGDDGKYDLNSEWKFTIDVELQDDLGVGENTVYGLWSTKVFEEQPLLDRSFNLFVTEENNAGEISSTLSFFYVDNDYQDLLVSIPFTRISDRIIASMDYSISKDSFEILVRDINGTELGRKELNALDLAPLEEGTMVIGKIYGYSVSTMILHSFIVTTLENQSEGTVHVRLKRFDNQATKGEDVLSLYDDSPLPSICLLEPMSGPSPLPDGDEGLKLNGVNFPENPIVYFWQPGAEYAAPGALHTDFSTWLSSDIHKYKDQDVIKSSTEGEIVTLIPYDKNTGYSMETGPIKIGDKNRMDLESNSATYTVDDCIGADPIPGFKCCTEGKDAKKWKPESYNCSGETVSAGYVWRFTTGLIPQVPYVIEECVEGLYPSPTPWQEHDNGTSACLNAEIGVRFNIHMDETSLVGNVKLRSCGQENQSDCDNNENEIGLEENNPVYEKNGNESLITIKPFDDLLPNTWYRVELNKQIQSNVILEELGQSLVTNVPLRTDRPCSDNTAYCYEFKTGSGANICKLESAGILPPVFTTYVLGLVSSPPKTANPLYYFIWGQSNLACIAIEVDGLGWQWSPKEADEETAYTESAPGDGYADSRARVYAEENNPEGEEITASTTIGNEDYLALSTLYISLGKPEADYWEPECETACLNSSILVDFNRHMASTTYKDGIHLYECDDVYDPDCTSFIEIEENKEEEDFELSTRFQLVFSPSNNLQKNTRYKVELTDDIKSLERLDPEKQGKGLVPVTWYFKTQNNAEPCKPAKLQVMPDPFFAQMIGEKTKYLAMPRQNPDECSKYGQLLNPSDYSYDWGTNPTGVAEITNYELGHAIAPFCNSECQKRGSEIYSTIDITKMYLCGNGVVDPGEDCDIGGVDENGAQEVAGASCALNCLRPGNTATGGCGNGSIDFVKGEQCDPGDANTGQYCNPNNCLLFGAESNTETGVCGDGSFTRNEACDNNLSLDDLLLSDELVPNQSRIGCNEKCLHEGTRPIASFCIGKTDEVCNGAVSVCGNGTIELGEECDNPESLECSTSCVLENNACDTSNKQCNKGNEGCDDNCILLGSSADYSIPSVCGDSNIGTGENSDCELEAGKNAGVGAGPVQIATAIGEGVVDAVTGAQTTQIMSNLLLDSAISGSAAYTLQCGYVEFDTIKKEVGHCEFNNKKTCFDTGGECDYDIKIPVTDSINQPTDTENVYIGPAEKGCFFWKTQEYVVSPVSGQITDNIYSFTGCLTPNDCQGLANYDLGNIETHEIGQYVFGGPRIAGTTSYSEEEFANYFTANSSDVTCHPFLNINEGQCIMDEIQEVDIGFSKGTVYNDCPDNQYNDRGVASNSCCRERPMRTDEYPKDLTGLSGDVPVCPNTQILASFDSEIDKNSLFGDNLMVVKGYKTEIDCADADVTDMISNALTLKNFENVERPSFLRRIWNNIKGFFVRILGNQVHAGEQINAIAKEGILTWCKTNIDARPEIHNEFVNVEVNGKIESEVETSTILFNIQDVLDGSSVYAAVILGGGSGVKNIDGVGIKHATSDNPSIVDVWVFKTGEEVCKLDAVWVEPAAHLFQAPFASHSFLARAISFTYKQDEGKDIVPVSGYSWSWDWDPKDSALFNIPFEGDSNTNSIMIRSTDLEGNVTGRAVATITEDSVGNNVGQKVIGATQLKSMFCERPWPPAEDELDSQYQDDKYNFRMSYCADDGLSGTENTGDDLPYLGSGVQFLDVVTDVEIAVPGACGYSQNECLTSADCVHYYDMNNSEQILISNSGKACIMSDQNLPGNILLPTTYGAEYRTCTEDVDCQNADGPEGENGLCRSILSHNMGSSIDNSCVGATTKIEEQTINQVLAEDTLKKAVFFNDKNEDIFGLQILKNEFRLPIRSWYETKFADSSPLQSLTIAGYEALTDGDTYYINAMNVTDTENPDSEKFHEIYNNIYLFSINEGAEASTRKVLDALLDSLEFNINMHDEGYCLNAGDTEDTDLYKNPLNYNSDYPCDDGTDFECMDIDGQPFEGLSGICSSARRKFDRDILRLEDVKSIQGSLQSGYPELAGGTYIPNYTVSRWPSWSKSDGLGISVLDPLNIWTSCDGESQTCWDGGKLEFHCPNEMSVYEYNYDAVTRKYNLFVNLEYFQNEGWVEDKFNSFVLDPEAFKMERKCLGGEKYTPHATSCGDGVIGGVAGGGVEECDPPGKVEVSNRGYKPENEGVCSFLTKEQACYTNTECLASLFTVDLDHAVVPHAMSQKVCTYSGADGQNRLIYGESVEHQGVDLTELSIFSCQTNVDCVAPTIEYSESLNMFGSDYTITDKSGITDDTFDCVQLISIEGYTNGANFVCTDGQVAGELGNCSSSESALKSCADSCTYEYGACKPINDCGNGIVEDSEKCDDGALNGTYGRCAGDCQGPHPDYCGDGVYNEANEFCEVVGDVQVAYHDVDEAVKARLKYGSAVSDVSDLPPLVLLFIGPGIQHFNNTASDTEVLNHYCEGDPKLLCSADEDCRAPSSDYVINLSNIDDVVFGNAFIDESEWIDFGPCKDGRVGSTHNFYREASCSYNCKSYGGYCGDGILQGFSEECDDGNDISNDECNNFCLENEEPVIQTPEDTTPSVAVGCGNGIIENEETNPEMDPDKWEECDLGDANGLTCEPGYGETCTYCTQGCKTLKVEPEEFCSDNNLQIEYEQCDLEDGLVTTASGSKQCSDKGEWQCLDDCQEPVGGCVNCGIIDDGARPKLTIINPATENAEQTFWEFLDSDVTLFRPLAFNDDGELSRVKYYNTVAGLSHTTSNLLGGVERLESDLMCKDEYYLYFNAGGIEQATGEESKSDQIKEGYGDVFEYPVEAQEDIINNHVIYSPAVPEGVFRVVVKWSKEDGGSSSFRGGLFVEDNNISRDNMLLYTQWAQNSVYCFSLAQDSGGYWMPFCPLAEQNFNGFGYAHLQFDYEDKFLHSFTIDTRKITNEKPTAFFVQSIDLDRIAQYKTTGLHVDVYEYHKGQNPAYSVYKPAISFGIRDAAGTSTNAAAKYWHVFNFEYSEDEGYQIVEKQSIETDECQLKKSVYNDATIEGCEF